MHLFRKILQVAIVGLALAVPSRALAWAWDYSSPNNMNVWVTAHGDMTLSALTPNTTYSVYITADTEGGQWWRMDHVWFNGNEVASYVPSTHWEGWVSFTTPSGAGNYTFSVQCLDGRGCWSNTLQVGYTVNSPPTVGWNTLPPSPLYVGTWFPVRATGYDSDGNLGGVFVEFSVNGGSWQGLAYDPAGVNGGNNYQTTSNNNGITAGAPGTTYQFRCYAWDQPGANSGWQYSGVYTVANRAPTMAISASPTSIYFGQTTTVTSTASDADGNLAFHGILALNPARTEWYRSPRTDHSTGWGNHTPSNDFLSENYTSGVTSGASNTRTVTYRPPVAGTQTFHSNAHDGSLWESSWYAAMYVDVAVAKATPNISGWGNQSRSGTGTFPGAFGVALSNPYSPSVATPTGAISFAVIGASGFGASPTSGAVGANTTFTPGSYTVRCTYAGDGNYNAATWDVNFSVGNVASVISITANGVSNYTTTYGQTVTITATGSDTDANLYNVDWMRYNGQYYRPGNADMSRIGWNGYPADGGYYTSQDFGNDAASGYGPVSKSAVFRPPSIGTFNFLGYAGDGLGNWGAWAYVNVNPAPLTITANNASRVYGAANPSFTASYSGFVNGDTSSVVSGLALSTSATAGTSPGTYPITPSGASAGNYTISYANGTLTISTADQAALSLNAAGTQTHATAQTLSTSGGSGGGAVTYAIVGQSAGGVATLSGATLTANTGTGWVDVQATKAPDTNYNGVTSNIVRVTFAKATATVSLGGLAQTYNGSPRAASATTSPAGLAVTLTYNGSTTAPTNATSYAVVGTISDANYTGSASGTLVVSKAAATVTLGSLNQTYSGAARTVTATTAPAGLTVNFTYDGSSTAPTNAGSYAIVGTINDTNYSGSATGTLAVAKATATVTLGSLTQTYSGTARVATATTSPAGLTVSFTYNGSTTAPTNANNYSVVATINDTNYAGSASGTLVVSKATASVTLGSLSATYNGSAKAATATTAPSGLTVTFTYNGSATAPSAAGSYAVVGTINDSNYTGSSSGTLVISAATATVTLGNLTQTYSGSARTATATTTPSALAVTVTYNGSTTPPTAPGSYAIVGTINDPNYSGSTSGTLVVNKVALTISAQPVSRIYLDSNPSFTPTYAGFVNGDTSAVVGAVTTSTTATAASDVGTYAIAVSGATSLTNYTVTYVPGTLTVTPKPITFTFSNTALFYNSAVQKPVITPDLGTSMSYSAAAVPPPPATTPTTATQETMQGNYSFRVTATGNYTGWADCYWSITCCDAVVTLDNLSFTYDGTGKSATATTNPTGHNVVLTYTDGSVTSTTSPINAGSYPVKGAISEPVDSHGISYNGEATGTLVIAKAPATVSLASLSQVYNGSPRVATSTTVPSGLAVGYTYDGSSSAPTVVGSYTVVATITDPNYTGSTSGTLVIGKGAQSALAVAAASSQIFNASQTLGATGGSGTGTVSFSKVAESASGIATLTNGVLTANSGTGWVDVQASRAGDSNYNAVSSPVFRVTFTKATATVALASLSQTYNGAARPATATSTPTGLTVSLTYDGSATAPSGAGSYAVVGTINDVNYQGSATGTLVVSKAAVSSVTLGSLSQTYNGSPRVASATTSPAGFAVTFTYDGSNAAPTNAGSYTVVGTVSDANYQGTATGTLDVAKAAATLALSNTTQTYNGSARSVTATTTPAGLNVSFTYDGGNTAPINAGSYLVVGTIYDTNYQGASTTTLVVNKIPATVTLGSLSQTYTGTARSVTTITSPAGLVVNCTYDGSATVPTNAGSYVVVATIADTNYQGTASGTLVVAKAAASVSLGSLSQTYSGTGRAASATTSPAGLGVVFTYDGSTTVPVNAGSYSVVGTINDTNYQGTASGTLTVAKAVASVSLGSLSQTYNGSSRPATASTTPGGLLVNFTYNGSPSVPINAGSYTVIGTVADNNYTGTASGTLVVSKATATLVLGNLAQTYNGSARIVTYTTSPAGLTVNLTYDTYPTAPVNAGSYAIGAAINDPNYQGAATGTLVVQKAPATVTLGALAQTYNGSPRTVTTTTSPAGLAVTVTYNGSLSAPLNAGSYAVVATIADQNYQGSTTGTLVVAKAAGTVTLGSLSHVYNGSTHPATAVTAPVEMTVTFTYNGSATPPTNGGTYTVVGTISDTNYQGSATGTLVIAKAPATVTLGSLSQTYDGSPRIPTATTAPAGLTVTYTYDGGSTAPINAGSYAVIGTIDSINYEGTASGTLVVAKAVAPMTLGNLAPTYTGTAQAATATTTPAGLPVNFTYNALSSVPINAGSYAVVGTIDHQNYQGTASATMVIAKAPLTVTVVNAAKIYGATNPSFSTTYSGFVNGESASVITGSASFTTSADTSSAVGTYPVTPSLGSLSAANYVFTPFVDGTLTVNKRSLTVTAEDKQRVQNTENPTLTACYDGFVNGDTVSALSGAPALDTPATISSPIGMYAIHSAAGTLTATNYCFDTCRQGTLEVTSPNFITFPNPPDKLTGDGSFTPTATASSGLPVTFQILEGPATASGSVVSLAQVSGKTTGLVRIRALQPGDGGTWPAAKPVDRTFTVYDGNADQDGDGVLNKDERSSMFSYDSRTSSMGQMIPQGWPNAAGSSTKAVGLTAGSLSVDKSGALTYSIPIKISPGTAGMQPQLTLNYSSQAGSGIAGFGWSLSGMSAISRGPQTRAVDGQVHGVDFTAADRYYLDGQRLIAISGADGANNTEYRTEVDSFSKIVSYASSGNSPTSFKVWTKAGLIIEFGNTTDSAAEAQGRSEIMTWAVNKISDTVGNYMTFTYAEDSSEGEQRLTQIDYSGSSTTATYASVRFTYEARTDVFHGYAAGSKIARTQRLKTIGAYVGETAVRKYTLNYTERTTANARSMLTSLTETGSDGTSYPDLVFDYETPTGGWEQSTSIITPFPMAIPDKATGAGLMDLNGDSFADFVRKRIDNSTTYSDDADLNTPSGWSANTAYHLPGVFTLAWDDRPDAGARFVDINGDGLVDIVFSCQNHDGTISTYATRNTGSGWADYPEAVIPSSQTYIAGYQLSDSGRRFVDVNGDGLPDLVWNTSSTDKGCLINNSNGQFQAGGAFWVRDDRWAPPFAIMADVSAGSQFFDVNGDGLPDLVKHGLVSTGIEAGVAINSPTGWTASATTFAADNTPYSTYAAQLGSLGKYLPPALLTKDGSGWSASPIGSEIVDLNGDGLPDIIMSNPRLPAITGSPRAFLNTGNGWVASSEYTPPYGIDLCGRTDGQDTDGTGAVVADLNGDGLPDLAVHRSDNTTGRIYYLNTGRGWGSVNTSYLPGDPDLKLPHAIVNGSLATPTGTQLGDLNGDGIVDSFTNGSIYSGTYPYYNKARPTADHLIKVTNGFGVAASVTYALLNERDASGNPTIYTKGASSTYPVVNVVGPMVVVKSVSNDDGAGGQHPVSYAYSGLRSHALYGSLGFETMTTLDERTGIVSTTSFRQDFPYMGMPSGSVTIAPKPGGGTVTLSSSSATYATKLLNSGKTRFIYADTNTATSYDLNNGDTVSQSTTTANDYDDYGNANTITVDTGGGYSKTTVSTYTNDTTNWFLGRLSKSTVTAREPGLGDVSRVAAFTYDSLTGLLLTEVVEPDDSAFKVTTTYTYDGFGNKTSAAVSGAGVITRTTSSLYTSNGRFPSSSTNAIGQSEVYSYDSNLGVVTSMTGPNGLSTSWSYDGFGTKTRETRSDGTITEIRTRWASTSSPAGAMYFTETESSGSPPTLSFYDPFGRAFQSLAINGAGQIIYQSTLYDNLSRAYASTVPYRNDGSPVYWTQTTSYDLLNRPLSVQTPDEAVAGGVVTTSFAYKGLTTEVTDAKGRVARSVKNLQGQVVTSTRNVGGAAETSVSYSYDGLGNLTSTNAAGVTTSLTYDKRGRKTQMVDADMGTWTYAYNVFGELISQTDAKAQTTTMTYDALGRMKTRVEAEGTTTWTYDTATNGKGKLAAVSAPGGYTETYTYDGQGRPSGITRTIDGTPYTIGQTYDGFGRPETTVYPTGFQTRNVFGSFGAIKEVRRADSSRTDLYWQADSYAVDGKVNGETYGNGVTADRVYSQATGRLYTAAVGLDPTNAIQHLSYTYDEVGNVETRADDPSGRTETFVYDTLDRLTSHALSGGATVTVSYDGKGNITNKSDVGNYSYNYTPVGRNSVLSHAVGTAGSNTYTYDANGNMLDGAGRTIAWTSFNQVKTITQGSFHTDFSFGAGHERVKQVAHNGTTLYVGSIWEKFTAGSVAEEKNYVMAPTGRVAVVTFGTNTPAAGTVNYFHADGLGSITAVTDESGSVIKRFAFDAWGKRINPAGGAAITSSTNGHFTRGYTDHEHLDDFGLIHMNGRVYDPVLGRFLSADPNVDGVYDSQGYNRYSYVQNNPMNRTDPSGFFGLKDVGMIVAAVVVGFVTAGVGLCAYAAMTGATMVGGLAGAIGSVTLAAGWGGGWAIAAGAGFGFGSSFAASLLNGGSIGDAFKAGVIGGVVGGISAGIAGKIGDYAQNNEWFQGAGQHLAHGALQGGLTEATGGQFRHGFYAGFFSSAAAPAIQGAFPDKLAAQTTAAAIVGGTASAIGGGKFANGAVSGAFTYLFNWSSHEGADVHRKAIEEVLNALGGSTSFTAEDVSIMAQAGRDLDNDQSAEHQYMHAMRNLDRNQTIAEAQELANYYIRDRLNNAYALVGAGDRAAGMYQLGLALHTIQDSTSPSHYGFQGWSQKWTDKGWRSADAVNHVRQEMKYPGNNSALFRATLTTMRMFEQGYSTGGNAFIFGHD